MPESSSPIHLIYYWNILLERRRVILVFTALLMAATALGSLLATPHYRAAAVVRIDPRTPVVFDVATVSDPTPANMWGPALQAFYTTQYRLMESRTVLDEAVRRLREEHGLADFDHAENPSAFLGRHLEIKPDPESQLVRVVVEYPDPDTAALIANTVTEAYIATRRAGSLQDTREAIRWLSDQLEVYRTRKVRSEEDVYRFQYEHALIGTEDGSHITVDTLRRLREAWTDAHARLVKVQANYDGLVDLSRTRDNIAVATHLAHTDPVLRTMLGRYQDLVSEQTRLGTRYQRGHPEMIRVGGELDGLEAQIQRQVETLIEAERTRLDLLKNEEERISARLRETQRAVQELGETLIQLELLRTEARRNEQFFRDLDTRLTEVGISQFLQASNVHIEETAISNPVPVRPKTLVNVAASLFLGLLGGGALALILAYFDFNVKTREDIEEAVGVPFLGMVQQVSESNLHSLSTPLERSVVVTAMPRSAVAESLRTIRTNIFFQLPKRKGVRLLVTSSVPREGKSFVTANLSALISANGRTLVIDGDLRRPTLHRLFQLSNDLGLKNVLSGERTLEGAIQATHVEGLDLLAAGTLDGNPAELLDIERLSAVLDAITGYDVVVVDSPPISVVSDASIFASLVDGLVFVIEAGRTSRSLAAQSVNQLRAVNPHLLGGILNKVDTRQAVYGYHYYSYGDQHGYYDDAEPDSSRSKRPA